MRAFLLLLTLTLSIRPLISQCDTNALLLHKHFAVVTDPNITGDIARHHAFYNPLCTPKNKLLLYMVGTINHPANDLYFTKLAANNGYHVISIVYENNTSAKSACFTENDTTCYENFHKEVIFGTPVSNAVNVDSSHSIYNRSIKLLQYLNSNYPSENWGQFYNGNNINWTSVITAGHSQGSGHATYLGHIYPVHRVLMFSGPNEYMDNYNRIAPWFATNNVTSAANYFGFGNIYDEISFDHQIQVWEKIGLNTFGDSINVMTNNCPYNNRKMLYTDSIANGSITPNHNSTMVDNYTPKNGNGSPVYEEAWKYMLDLCGTPTNISKESTLFHYKVYPNPVDEMINIEFLANPKNTIVNIKNTIGEIVLSKKLNTDLQQNIYLSELNPGIYFLEIRNLNFNKTEKFIKQ